MKKKLNTAKVKLLNDLEAMALGMLYLPEHDLVELNPNAESQSGNIAVIAAGTGLGEAILYWDGNKHHPMATEGGHSDFAAKSAQQDLLLHILEYYTLIMSVASASCRVSVSVTCMIISVIRGLRRVALLFLN